MALQKAIEKRLYDQFVSAINFHTKEISVKIVYYGPGLCGKTTSLQAIYNSLPEERRNQFVSLATEVDRTIFFDFLPVTAFKIREFTVRQQLYTVPGQVFYNATRKLVLNGVDGLVFVVDSQRAMQDSNLESLQNLDDNLRDLGMDAADVPMVIQANKRDLSDVFSVEEVDERFNPRKVPVFGTVATTGEGVPQALKTVSQLVVNNLLRKGMGRRILAQDTPASAEPDGGGLSATVAAAAEAAVQTPRPTGVSLWPDTDTAAVGDRIVAGIESGQWAAAVLASEELIRTRAGAWAREINYEPSGAVPPFLWLRGAHSTRYRIFAEAVAAARGQKEVSRKDAMAALILALETVW